MYGERCHDFTALLFSFFFYTPTGARATLVPPLLHNIRQFNQTALIISKFIFTAHHEIYSLIISGTSGTLAPWGGQEF
jgi:hypothetical protein